MNRDTFDMFKPRSRGRFGDDESAEVRGNDDVRSDLVDLTLALHYETPARGTNPGAIRVSIDGDDDKAKWIPKSRCQFERRNSTIAGRDSRGNRRSYDLALVTLPERYAKDLGLI